MSTERETLPWLDKSLTDERRYMLTLAAIRDQTPHAEYENAYCPACLAELALNPDAGNSAALPAVLRESE